MNKLTFDDIRLIINSNLFDENDCDPEKWMYEDVPTSIDELDDDSPIDLKADYEKLGKIEMVKHRGGEGEGDSYYSVYHFIDHDVYIQFDGWWVSHAGAEYNEMFEVWPEQVTITQYNQIKK